MVTALSWVASLCTPFERRRRLNYVYLMKLLVRLNWAVHIYGTWFQIKTYRHRSSYDIDKILNQYTEGNIVRLITHMGILRDDADSL